MAAAGAADRLRNAQLPVYLKHAWDGVEGDEQVEGAREIAEGGDGVRPAAGMAPGRELEDLVEHVLAVPGQGPQVRRSFDPTWPPRATWIGPPRADRRIHRSDGWSPARGSRWLRVALPATPPSRL